MNSLRSKLVSTKALLFYIVYLNFSNKQNEMSCRYSDIQPKDTRDEKRLSRRRRETKAAEKAEKAKFTSTFQRVSAQAFAEATDSAEDSDSIICSSADEQLDDVTRALRKTSRVRARGKARAHLRANRR